MTTVAGDSAAAMDWVLGLAHQHEVIRSVATEHLQSQGLAAHNKAYTELIAAVAAGLPGQCRSKHAYHAIGHLLTSRRTETGTKDEQPNKSRSRPAPAPRTPKLKPKPRPRPTSDPDPLSASEQPLITRSQSLPASKQPKLPKRTVAAPPTAQATPAPAPEPAATAAEPKDDLDPLPTLKAEAAPNLRAGANRPKVKANRRRPTRRPARPGTQPDAVAPAKPQRQASTKTAPASFSGPPPATASTTSGPPALHIDMLGANAETSSDIASSTRRPQQQPPSQVAGASAELADDDTLRQLAQPLAEDILADDNDTAEAALALVEMTPGLQADVASLAVTSLANRYADDARAWDAGLPDQSVKRLSALCALLPEPNAGTVSSSAMTLATKAAARTPALSMHLLGLIASLPVHNDDTVFSSVAGLVGAEGVTEGVVVAALDAMTAVFAGHVGRFQQQAEERLRASVRQSLQTGGEPELAPKTEQHAHRSELYSSFLATTQDLLDDSRGAVRVATARFTRAVIAEFGPDGVFPKVFAQQLVMLYQLDSERISAIARSVPFTHELTDTSKHIQSVLRTAATTNDYNLLQLAVVSLKQFCVTSPASKEFDDVISTLERLSTAVCSDIVGTSMSEPNAGMFTDVDTFEDHVLAAAFRILVAARAFSSQALDAAAKLTASLANTQCAPSQAVRWAVQFLVVQVSTNSQGGGQAYHAIAALCRLATVPRGAVAVTACVEAVLEEINALTESSASREHLVKLAVAVLKTFPTFASPELTARYARLSAWLLDISPAQRLPFLRHCRLALVTTNNHTRALGSLASLGLAQDQNPLCGDESLHHIAAAFLHGNDPTTRTAALQLLNGLGVFTAETTATCGQWINSDEQRLRERATVHVLLAARHSVGCQQVQPPCWDVATRMVTEATNGRQLAALETWQAVLATPEGLSVVANHRDKVQAQVIALLRHPDVAHNQPLLNAAFGALVNASRLTPQELRELVELQRCSKEAQAACRAALHSRLQTADDFESILTAGLEHREILAMWAAACLSFVIAGKPLPPTWEFSAALVKEELPCFWEALNKVHQAVAVEPAPQTDEAGPGVGSDTQEAAQQTDALAPVATTATADAGTLTHSDATTQAALVVGADAGVFTAAPEPDSSSEHNRTGVVVPQQHASVSDADTGADRDASAGADADANEAGADAASGAGSAAGAGADSGAGAGVDSDTDGRAAADASADADADASASADADTHADAGADTAAAAGADADASADTAADAGADASPDAAASVAGAGIDSASDAGPDASASADADSDAEANTDADTAADTTAGADTAADADSAAGASVDTAAPAAESADATADTAAPVSVAEDSAGEKADNADDADTAAQLAQDVSSDSDQTNAPDIDPAAVKSTTAAAPAPKTKPAKQTRSKKTRPTPPTSATKAPPTKAKRTTSTKRATKKPSARTDKD
eukprot:m.16712 g.16712  ORF g.16712 m.16712 type:complete len:1452 (-) comp5314_c0_seq2:43-4398(-)